MEIAPLLLFQYLISPLCPNPKAQRYKHIFQMRSLLNLIKLKCSIQFFRTRFHSAFELPDFILPSLMETFI